MPLKVTPLPQVYRGFRLGYAVGRHGYLPAWRSSMDREWYVSHVYADDNSADVVRLAKECIDFRYKADTFEVYAGRPPTMEELKHI